MKATVTIDGYTVELEGTPEEVTKVLESLKPPMLTFTPLPIMDSDWPWPTPYAPMPTYPMPNQAPMFQPYYTVTCKKESDVL